VRRILIQFCVRTVIWIRKLLLAGAITLPLARPRRPIVGLGRRSLSFTPALLEAWFNWEGGQVRLDASPRLLTPVRPSSSSSPHLSLFSAASRCFAVAITLPFTRPRRALIDGLGLRYSELPLHDLITSTSGRVGLAQCDTRPIVEWRPVPFCVRFL